MNWNLITVIVYHLPSNGYVCNVYAGSENPSPASLPSAVCSLIQRTIYIVHIHSEN